MRKKNNWEEEEKEDWKRERGVRVKGTVVHSSTPFAAIFQGSHQGGQGGEATVGVPGPPGGHPGDLHTLHLHQQGQLAMESCTRLESSDPRPLLDFI